MPAIIRLLFPVLGTVYAGSGVVHELKYAGDNLLSSKSLLFKSLHKVKWFADFLAKGQKIRQHGGATAGMAIEAHFAKE